MVGYCHIQPYVAMVHCFAKQGEVIKKDGGADTKEGGVVPFPRIHFCLFSVLPLKLFRITQFRK